MQKPCQVVIHVVIRAVILGPLVLAWLGESAAGQSLVPSAGNIVPSLNGMNRHHMAPTGRPCLTLNGSARSQAINPHIFEHWVSAANICGQNIKLQVCYRNSQDCITMNVPPWGHTDSVLGIYPALADFQFDAKEQF